MSIENGYSDEINSTLIQQHRGYSFPTVPKLILYNILYFIGVFGSSLALIHLCQKKNFKNPKHALMLKCLVGCDLIGLCGMFTQKDISLFFDNFYESNMQFFCKTFLLWRFCGLCSGCVAFVMAFERWFALTKPFLYYKYITNGLIKKSIITLWFLSGIINLCPLLGFGTYFDGKKCARHRDAKDYEDIIYAYLFFFIGVVICVCILICNFSVSKILYKSYHQMQITLSSLEISQSVKKVGSLKHRISDYNSSTPTRSSFVTRDEVRFAKLMILLSITFVLCWGCQMVTIPLWIMGFRFKCFEFITDILLLVHFIMDPYIYVLFKTNYWLKLKKCLHLSSGDDFDRTSRPSRVASVASNEFWIGQN